MSLRLGLGRRRRALDQAAQARRVAALVDLYAELGPLPALQLIAAAGINAITSAATQAVIQEAYEKTLAGVRAQIAADGLDPREGGLLEASLGVLRDRQLGAVWPA
ncbi:hypothetical protein [Pseudomonas sp. MWU12-2323]|uniref:hypothetical protein n=1 Tax=Pseudomonas sp. MWU12-2323 TaxID=2651296 RepID=UPI00128BF0AC|nr:hypothetical protein [Pseudomonas sp. MWU12-2323]MPQ69302.1 hypothetical protein [Pseudomonas sp. MWU12-2323]